MLTKHVIVKFANCFITKKDIKHENYHCPLHVEINKDYQMRTSKDYPELVVAKTSAAITRV